MYALSVPVRCVILKFKRAYVLIILTIVVFYSVILFMLGSINNELKYVSDKKPFFQKHASAKDLQCHKFFARNIQNALTSERKRVRLKDSFDVGMDCDSIRRRHYFPSSPLSEEEKSFAVAFIRIVHTDYLFLELMLAMEYAPQNVYCYSIDGKASAAFKGAMRKLSNCFENVFIAKEEFDVDNSGHNMSSAFIECLKTIRDKQWKYVVLLQNHDVTLRTNRERVEILKLLNGTNDVGVGRPWMERINKKLDWSFAQIRLFRDDSKNTNRKIRFAKGVVQSSISREAAVYMLDKLNLQIFIKQLELGSYGLDEMFMATLQADDYIGLPGGFYYGCIEKYIDVPQFTRKSIWFNKTLCYSRYLRHGICIHGVEDLHRLSRWPYLYVNKMMPEFDFGAIFCWAELLFNRTYMHPEDNHLNPEFYLSLPSVRHHSLGDFNCNHTHAFID
ncbi:hypothetical protein QR680_008444 [Steinernema hermaphroditum]|uniref:Core-2/I-Branching enzyme n=1 Tax=Steinernema hermaphroditum TaxID=289476 RepID=A0AA39IGL1_9BILA|nr:hypothetical protein QR680_008444 [Steinernema hermaphroditum]